MTNFDVVWETVLQDATAAVRKADRVTSGNSPRAVVGTILQDSFHRPSPLQFKEIPRSIGALEQLEGQYVY